MGKRFSIMVTTCLSIAVSTGCSSGEKTSVTTDVPAASNEPVTLNVFWNSGSDEATFNTLWGDSIKKKFPNITIQYFQWPNSSKLQELLTAGTTETSQFPPSMICLMLLHNPTRHIFA